MVWLLCEALKMHIEFAQAQGQVPALKATGKVKVFFTALCPPPWDVSVFQHKKGASLPGSPHTGKKLAHHSRK
jgi:hypothetical protein